MEIDRIISKYLEGEISLDEQHKLIRWIEEDQANRHAFEEISKYWKSYTAEHRVAQEEVEAQIFNRIGNRDHEASSGGSFNYRLISGIAASVLIIIASLLYLNPFGEPEQTPLTVLEKSAYVEKASLPGQKITTRLPDGTMVRLNSGSRLVVPEQFADDSREVELIGEAFFDVAKDPNRPFIITTEEFTIRVLGTTFNVSAYPDKKQKHVAVRTGLVNVKSGFNKSVELSPDQMVNIGEGGAISEVSKVDEALVFGWIDQLLVFRDRSLTEVFEQIELWYGVELDFNDQLVPEKPITASFDNPTLEEVLSNISKVYGFKYEIDENKVVVELNK